MSANRKGQGLAYFAEGLAQDILKRDQDKRDFHQKLEAALFENELKQGRIRPSKAGEKPDSTYGDIGFSNISPEEQFGAETAKMKAANRLIPPGSSGSYLPDVPGMKYHPGRATSSSGMMNQSRAIAIQGSRNYRHLHPQAKALVDYVANGGDPATFKGQAPAPQSSPPLPQAPGPQFPGPLPSPGPVSSSPQVTKTGHRIGERVKGKDGMTYEIIEILPNGDAKVRRVA